MKKVCLVSLLLVFVSACTDQVVDKTVEKYCVCAKPTLEQAAKVMESVDQSDLKTNGASKREYEISYP